MTKTNTDRDLFFSLAAQGTPAILALVSIPILLGHYGIERFGLLTFFWTLLNWISFLDLGITRTLTKSLAESGKTLTESAQRLMKSSFVLVLSMGTFGCILILLSQNWIFTQYLKISEALLPEAQSCLLALAFSFPSLLLFSFFKSSMEGRQIFPVANKMQFVTGVLSYAAPLLSLFISNRLDTALWILMILRWALVVWAFNKVRIEISLQWFKQKIIFSDFKNLFRVGIWFSLLTIISPLLIYLDRFLVSSFVPMSELAYYTTPFEIVTRFWLIPAAVVRIIFPVFSSHQGLPNQETFRVFRRGLLWIAFLTIPAALILGIWSKTLLGFWLGKDFGDQSALILQILLFGIVLNCLNWIPFTLIQASRHIRWTVYIPLIELGLFLIIYFPLVEKYGVVGAAVAWSLRLGVDALVWFGASAMVFQSNSSKRK